MSTKETNKDLLIELLKKDVSFKDKEIDRLEKENEELREENKHIFANVNDDELLRSNAMNYAEANELRQRIDEAVEYLEHEQFKRTILGFGRDKYLDAMKNKTIRILRRKRK